MASNYKTPGVYVEEINSLPGIISRVPTAVPAFIGYTEKGPTNTPTKISSMLEYEETFGGGHNPTIDVDTTNLSVSYDHLHIMYDAMKLYFRNGGGDCYIVSVGGYGSLASANLEAGIATLEKEDEPTLIVVPEAVHLSSGFTSVQTAMLDHCKAMGDRFALLDLPDDQGDSHDPKTYRTGLSGQDLSYGAAYTPWLKTLQSLPVIEHGNIVLDGGSNDFWDVSSDTILAELGVVDNDVYIINAKIALHSRTLSPAANETTSTSADIDSWIQQIVDVAKEIFTIHPRTAPPGHQLGNPVVIDLLRSKLESQAANSLYYWIRLLTQYLEGANSQFGATVSTYLTYATDFNSSTPHPITGPNPAFTWDFDLDTVALTPITSIYTTTDVITTAPADTDAEYVAESEDDFQAILDGVFAVFDALNAEATAYMNSLIAQIEGGASGYYASVVAAIEKSKLILPPSAAIAGVISQVDREVGVWKAPANISLRGIEKPMRIFSSSELDDLNVHSTGKSINAIREFRGKGIRVYGARTLDGNSNEWRYIPVRRLFLMAEESIKKAVEAIVFDNNDEKTWGRVSGMVGNFLNGLWRDGALAGSRPEQAFYVKVGLNQTMNAVDILEGRLIVEIGLAAVRPAEFIITRFSHKLPEA